MLNNKLSNFILVIMSVLFMTSVAYTAPSANDIVKKVKDKYKSLKTISIKFDQHLEWKLAGTSSVISGKIFIKGDDKFRVETGDAITITDGKTVWNYSKATNQVIISKMEKEDIEQLPSKILFQYTEKYRAKFLREEKLNEHETYVLEMTSKTGDDFIQKMTIWVDKNTWLTQKIEQHDIQENVKTFTITSMIIDHPLQQSLFTFQTPAGVEEIDMRKK